MNRLFVANFGLAYTGLSTVGYTMLNSDGTTFQARTTTGVSEAVSGSGIYFVNVNVSDDFDGIVAWDDGGSTPVYACLETVSQLNAIQRETDVIRLIWNTLRNQADFYSRLTDKLSKLDSDVASVSVLVDKLLEKKGLTKDEIKDILTVNVKAPDVVIPETRIPDYTALISSISSELKKVAQEVVDMKSKTVVKDNKEEFKFSRLLEMLSGLETAVKDIKSSDKYSEIKSELKQYRDSTLNRIQLLQDSFKKLGDVMSSLSLLNQKLDSLDLNNKQSKREFERSRKEMLEKIHDLNNYFKGVVDRHNLEEMNRQKKEVLLTIGHKWQS